MSGFKFADAPFLVQKRILELAEPRLSFHLARSSPEMEFVVKQARVKSSEMSIDVGQKSITIPGHVTNLSLQFEGKKASDDGEPQADLKHVISVVPWLIGVHNPQKLNWQLDNVTNEDVKLLMTFAPFEKKTRHVTFESGQLDSETMTSLLDHLHLNGLEKFESKCTLPDDFKHPNPFRVAETTMYSNANWFKAEDLLAMDANTVHLQNTGITSYDVNCFLRKWILTDRDMVRDLKIEMSKMNWAMILMGIPTLMFNNDGVKTLLVAPRNPAGREGQLGWIHENKEAFEFTAVPAATFPGKAEAFRLLYLSGQLDDEVEELTKRIEEEEGVEVASWISEEGRQKIRKLRELETAKTDAERQYAEVMQKLEEMHVDISTGRAIMYS